MKVSFWDAIRVVVFSDESRKGMDTRYRWLAEGWKVGLITGVLTGMTAWTVTPMSRHTHLSRADSLAQHDSSGAILQGNPSNYTNLLKELGPGDTLLLAPGVYGEAHKPSGLTLFGINGAAGSPIVIRGPDSGPRPVFLGQPDRNTVRIGDSSYLVLQRIELDGRNQPGIDAVKSEKVSHHIVLDGLVIHDYQGEQGDVGISTKAPAWNWVIRNTRIFDVGTGMYLGNSDGSAPFVRGLIECNVIADTVGYNLQIKHQNVRPELPGLPTDAGATIIRHNVFDKSKGGARGHLSRPNLLVGHFPLQGPGSEDFYEIYGNFFYQNPTRECLFQGEGNLALYANLFFNSEGSAVCVQPHNDVPRQVRVFHNTVVARAIGIRVIGGHPEAKQLVQANLVFALRPVIAPLPKGNITGDFSAAASFLARPYGDLDVLDFYPRPRRSKATPLRVSDIEGFHEADRDFNGQPYRVVFRGAYSGEGRNPRKLFGPRHGLCGSESDVSLAVPDKPGE